MAECYRLAVAASNNLITEPASLIVSHSPRYCGRFAPSPTGPLHFGSLVAALASFLDARQHDGIWLLRMEDLDQARCSLVAAEGILRTLEAFGFEWDAPVVWQSQRTEAYQAALSQLQKQDSVFPCACTRRELADSQLAPDGAVIYPGTCRHGLPDLPNEGRKARAWRVRVNAEPISFEDRVQGASVTNLAHESGDFVVYRADGVFAYQLAVVVDDAEAGITDVVRGADLFASTPRQIWLQRCLGLPTPRYAHVPVAVNAAGEKLSKQTLAAPLDAAQPVPALHAALGFLGQTPPHALRRASLHELWQWARQHWQWQRLPRRQTIEMEKLSCVLPTPRT